MELKLALPLIRSDDAIHLRKPEWMALVATEEGEEEKSLSSQNLSSQ